MGNKKNKAKSRSKKTLKNSPLDIHSATLETVYTVVRLNEESACAHNDIWDLQKELKHVKQKCKSRSTIHVLKDTVKVIESEIEALFKANAELKEEIERVQTTLLATREWQKLKK